MSDIENYDGLCGVHARFANSDLQVRCKYSLIHQGPHSWEKYRSQFIISSSCCALSEKDLAEQGFLNSVFSKDK